MVPLSLGSILILLVASLLLLLRWAASSSSSSRQPRALPLIGHLHLLAKGHPHRVLLELASRYNAPVLLLRFGLVPIAVASTKEAAMEFLQKHDAVFASRPPCLSGELLHYNQHDMGLARYGHHWRQLRRLCTLQLFTAKRLASFRGVRMHELRALLQSVASSQAAVLDVRSNLPRFTFNIITRMAVGKRYLRLGCSSAEDGDEEDHPAAREFMDVMVDVVEVLGGFAVADYLPYLRWLDPDGALARTKITAKRTHEFIEGIINERDQERKQQQQQQQQRFNDEGQQPSDFLEELLKLRDEGEPVLQGDTVPALMIDVLAAGTETSTVAVEWALAELICHPGAMSAAQRELDAAVGPTPRLLEEADVERLPYFQAVVKETFRLHPPVPLLLPHHSMQECTVMGNRVAQGTTLYVNTYAIGRSRERWGEDAEEFRPDRFLLAPAQGDEKGVDVRGRDFELLPFGSGRRMCPALSLGLANVHLALANLLLVFDWELPPGQRIDTTAEKFGLTVLLANRLQAIPRVRQAGLVEALL